LILKSSALNHDKENYSPLLGYDILTITGDKVHLILPKENTMTERRITVIAQSKAKPCWIKPKKL